MIVVVIAAVTIKQVCQQSSDCALRPCHPLPASLREAASSKAGVWVVGTVSRKEEVCGKWP